MNNEELIKGIKEAIRQRNWTFNDYVEHQVATKGIEYIFFIQDRFNSVEVEMLASFDNRQKAIKERIALINKGIKCTPVEEHDMQKIFLLLCEEIKGYF